MNFHRSDKNKISEESDFAPFGLALKYRSFSNAVEHGDRVETLLHNLVFDIDHDIRIPIRMASGDRSITFELFTGG